LAQGRPDTLAQEQHDGEQQQPDDGEVEAGRDHLQDLADADIEKSADHRSSRRRDAPMSGTASATSEMSTAKTTSG